MVWVGRQHIIARRCAIVSVGVSVVAVLLGMLVVFPVMYDVDPTLLASWIIMGLPVVGVAFLVVFSVGGLWVRRWRRRFLLEGGGDHGRPR